MEEQWRDMLAGFATLKRSEDVERSQGSLPPQLAAFRKLVAELDKLDPGGADRRAAESKAVVSKVEEMLRARGLQLWENHDERSLRLLREHKEYFK